MIDSKIHQHGGFTLFEIIAVLVVVSIVSVVVATRMWDTSANLVAQTEVIKTHLRYAQSRAMSSNVIWGIFFNKDTDTYALFRNGNSGDTVLLPGESSINLSLPVDISASEVVSFDSWGRPYDDAAGTSPHGGGQIVGLSITITKNTGFIP
jgi:MSHA pilin protein MshC